MDLLPLWSRFREFLVNTLKSRLQLNHLPVHVTHNAKVRKITTTSKTQSMARIVPRWISVAPRPATFLHMMWV